MVNFHPLEKLSAPLRVVRSRSSSLVLFGGIGSNVVYFSGTYDGSQSAGLYQHAGFKGNIRSRQAQNLAVNELLYASFAG